MVITPTPKASYQASLAEQFAAPNLYRSDTPQNSSIRFKYVDHLGAEKEAAEVDQVPEGAAFRPSLVMGLDTVRLCNDQGNPDFLPYIQRAAFYADKIVVYPQQLEARNNPTDRTAQHKNLTRGIFNGYISRNTASTIRKRLEGWIKAVQINNRSDKFGNRPKHSHITFLTVTLPSDQIHADNEIKRKCLMPFIQQLKRLYGVQEYFWCAQPQVNGNVHFHLLVDRWLDKDRINDHWNIAVDHLGYLARYVEKTGSLRPPSTQIQACPENMSLVGYVMKYVSRSPEVRSSLRLVDGQKVKRVSLWECKKIAVTVDQARIDGVDLAADDIQIRSGFVYRSHEVRRIDGRCWGCSDGVRAADIFKQDVTYRVADLVEVMKWDSSVRIVQRDHCEIYYLNVFDFMLRHDLVILSDYRRYYLKLYEQLYLDAGANLVPEVIEVDFLAAGVDQVEIPKYRQLQLLA